MLRKWISMTLASFMVFSLLSGCVKSSEAKNTDATSKENIQSQNTPESTQIPDLNGAVIKIVTQGYDLIPTGGNETGDLNVRWFEDIQKKYNCKIEISKNEVSDEFILDLESAVAANQKYADFICVQTDIFFEAALRDLLESWDGVADTSSSKLIHNYNKDYAQSGLFDGKLYHIAIADTVKASDVIYFNKTIFKKYGIESPYDLVRKNQWNWENFRKIAKQATIDTDNDGVTDIWGISNLGHADRVAGFYFANRATLVQTTESGKIEVTIDDPAYIETMEFLRDLAQVDKSMQMTEKGPSWNEGAKLFASGKCAMTAHNSMSKGIKEGFQDELGCVPFPMGPKATTYTGGTPFMYGFMIPKNVDNLEDKAIVLLDWITNNPYLTKEENDTRRYNDVALYGSDLDIVDMFKIIDNQDMLFEFSRPLSSVEGFYDTTFNVISGKLTVQEAIKTQKARYQSKINELYSNRNK
ncbi:ABC transporter substrate-binding protein [Acetivibrio cellulolyticus]|uniref:ABC transporter substrate-binding protein n=1 Tax=Acetivibrio cellulolyticus TaxID=35830 RepID=UPI0001E301D1|nr:extracellular solute-binding protein [Acetivibrio cellulolyticus]